MTYSKLNQVIASSQPSCFTAFKRPIAAYPLPEKFTFPFYYQPHPLCILAAQELQDYLVNQTEWQHDFGNIEQNFKGNKIGAIGKMFGVLLVENVQGELGYLSAFSGKLAEKNVLLKFVPPVFDMLKKESFFHAEQLVINQLNSQIDKLTINPEIALLQSNLLIEQGSAEAQLESCRQKNISNRKERKVQRASGGTSSLSKEKLDELAKMLAIASVADKNQLKDLKQFWQGRVDTVKEKLSLLLDEIEQLKDKRKQLSNNLQEKIFAQYRFSNVVGDEKNLTEIFSSTAFHQRYHQPPAGAGECAAPKLLQYAFSHNMKPLAMAEFWWGQAPKSEIRQHKNFYASCMGKCHPILSHMLTGLVVDDNPLLENTGRDKHLDIIYQDDDILLVNKPAELLSVPGKEITDCVYSRIKQLYPQATGSLIVHRLDMSTSGLMVIALTKQAHKNLQKQFINRSVKKHYIALLSGCLDDYLTEKKGQINLPLAGDFDDRPRQLVCFETGKQAETSWEIIETKAQQTNKKYSRVQLTPKTGRTHQLRVHCAHPQGLNMPILGDDLYGKRTDRLHLHAALLVIKHPVTDKLMTFESAAPF